MIGAELIEGSNDNGASVTDRYRRAVITSDLLSLDVVLSGRLCLCGDLCLGRYRDRGRHGHNGHHGHDAHRL